MARTDGQTDGQTDGGDHHNIPTFFSKSVGIMTCIMSILPSIHVSSFMKKYEELLKLSQDPEKCNGLTDTQSANHKSPPVKPVGDNNKVYRNNVIIRKQKTECCYSKSMGNYHQPVLREYTKTSDVFVKHYVPF